MTDEKDYDAAAAWAEHDMIVKRGAASTLRGAAAAAEGRELIERSQGGRPSIDPAAAPGQESPVRQVRLPRALDEGLEALAESQHRTASEIMRDAISDYLAAHKVAS